MFLSWFILPIERYGRNAHCANKHVCRLKERRELAKKQAEYPRVLESLVRIERYTKNAQCQIGDGQVEYEQIACGAHVLVKHNRPYDENVAEEAENDDEEEDDNDALLLEFVQLRVEAVEVGLAALEAVHEVNVARRGRRH